MPLQRRLPAGVSPPSQRNANLPRYKSCEADGEQVAKHVYRAQHATPQHAKAARWGPRCCAPTKGGKVIEVRELEDSAALVRALAAATVLLLAAASLMAAVRG